MNDDSKAKVPAELDEGWRKLASQHPPLPELIAAGRRRRGRQRIASVAGCALVLAAAGALVLPGLVTAGGTEHGNRSAVTPSGLDAELTVMQDGPPPSSPFATWSSSSRLLTVTIWAFNPTCPPEASSAETSSGQVTITLTQSKTPQVDQLCAAVRAPGRIVVKGLTAKPTSVIIKYQGTVDPIEEKSLNVTGVP